MEHKSRKSIQTKRGDFVTEWLVGLIGDKFDLEELPKLFRSDALRVTEEHDGYYLKSSEFESLSNADDVRAKAKTLLQHLNGVSKLFLSTSKPIQIGGITIIDEKESTTILK